MVDSIYRTFFGVKYVLALDQGHSFGDYYTMDQLPATTLLEKFVLSDTDFSVVDKIMWTSV